MSEYDVKLQNDKATPKLGAKGLRYVKIFICAVAVLVFCFFAASYYVGINVQESVYKISDELVEQGLVKLESRQYERGLFDSSAKLAISGIEPDVINLNISLKHSPLSLISGVFAKADLNIFGSELGLRAQIYASGSWELSVDVASLSSDSFVFKNRAFVKILADKNFLKSFLLSAPELLLKDGDDEVRLQNAELTFMSDYHLNIVHILKAYASGDELLSSFAMLLADELNFKAKSIQFGQKFYGLSLVGLDASLKTPRKKGLFGLDYLLNVRQIFLPKDQQNPAFKDLSLDLAFKNLDIAGFLNAAKNADKPELARAILSNKGLHISLKKLSLKNAKSLGASLSFELDVDRFDTKNTQQNAKTKLDGKIFLERDVLELFAPLEPFMDRQDMALVGMVDKFVRESGIFVKINQGWQSVFRLNDSGSDIIFSDKMSLGEIIR